MPTHAHLELADGKTKYRPGETVEGVAFWDVSSAPQSIEVRLFWRTQGKGLDDLEIVRNVTFIPVGPQDRRPFQLVLPAAPYSVSGKLRSLCRRMVKTRKTRTRPEVGDGDVISAAPA